jgi:arginyl-tRNA synthetase
MTSVPSLAHLLEQRVTNALIIQKSDGGYGYATTDLAAIRYRVGTLSADQMLYVVDSRQALHFRMVFETARRGVAD